MPCSHSWCHTNRLHCDDCQDCLCALLPGNRSVPACCKHLSALPSCIPPPLVFIPASTATWCSLSVLYEVVHLQRRNTKGSRAMHVRDQPANVSGCALFMCAPVGRCGKHSLCTGMSLPAGLPGCCMQLRLGIRHAAANTGHNVPIYCICAAVTAPCNTVRAQTQLPQCLVVAWRQQLLSCLMLLLLHDGQDCTA